MLTEIFLCTQYIVNAYMCIKITMSTKKRKYMLLYSTSCFRFLLRSVKRFSQASKIWNTLDI